MAGYGAWHTFYSLCGLRFSGETKTAMVFKNPVHRFDMFSNPVGYVLDGCQIYRAGIKVKVDFPVSTELFNLSLS